MKHAIILGHPDPNSFNMSVAAAYAAAVADLGHTSELRDLYRIGFDPCLRSFERPGLGQRRVANDVTAEREMLKNADVFVFVYPIWFGGPPAIIKGYIDRVFGEGYAFEGFHAGRAQPLLREAKFITFSSSGATQAWLGEKGVCLLLPSEMDHYLADLWGAKVLDHVHFPSVTPDMARRWVLENLFRVTATVRKHFAPADASGLPG